MEKCWPLRLSWTFKNLSWVFPYCLKRAGFHWKFQLPKQPTIWMLSWDRKSTLVLIPFCNKVWEDRWILGLNMRFSKIATRLNVFTWAAAVLTGWKNRTVHLRMENYQTEQKFDWRVYSSNFIWFKLMYLIRWKKSLIGKCIEGAPTVCFSFSASASVSPAGFGPENHNSYV